MRALYGSLSSHIFAGKKPASQWAGGGGGKLTLKPTLQNEHIRTEKVLGTDRHKIIHTTVRYALGNLTDKHLDLPKYPYIKIL